jgi:hypothetical protein
LAELASIQPVAGAQYYWTYVSKHLRLPSINMHSDAVRGNSHEWLIILTPITGLCPSSCQKVPHLVARM